MTCTHLNACMVCRNCKMPAFYCGHRAENYLTSSGRLRETRGYKHVASETIIQCAGHMLLSSTSVFSGLKKWSAKNFVFLIIAHDVRLHTGELRRRTTLCPNRHFHGVLEAKDVFSLFLETRIYFCDVTIISLYTGVELKWANWTILLQQRNTI